MAFFNRKPAAPRRYLTPPGQYYTLYADMLAQPHLLIAGATGSGKSVVINGLIATALYKGPAQAALILIDPKRVELVSYRDCPHCLRYASEPEEMIQALQDGLILIEARYREMQAARIRKYTGGDVFIIVDELADLLTTNRKQALPLLQRIAQIGRAASVHLIAATQCPIAKILSTELRVNFDSAVGLHTRSAQDSRNILGVTGCETLPRYGKGYYLTPEGLRLYTIPMYPEEELDRLAHYWTSAECIAPPSVR